MAEYCVKASGCDDATEVIVELSESEIEVVKRIARLVTDASAYGCMPRLHVWVPSEEDRTRITERLEELAEEEA